MFGETFKQQAGSFLSGIHYPSKPITSDMPRHGSDVSSIPPQLQCVAAILSDDDRPTFILDGTAAGRVAYRNEALRCFIALRSDSSSFETWANRLAVQLYETELESSAIDAGIFGEISWRRKALGNGCWAVVYGSWTNNTLQKSPVSPSASAATHRPPPPSHVNGSDSHLLPVDSIAKRFDPDLTSNKPSDWVIDWIRCDCTPRSPWIQQLKDHDWENTALGPMQEWPNTLCQLIISQMPCPEPRFVIWGDESLVVYNEAAATAFFGDQALRYLGNPTRDIPGQTLIADEQVKVLRHSVQTGQALKIPNVLYTRAAPLGDLYFNVVAVSVAGDDGRYAGSVIEMTLSTSVVLQQRRKMLAAEVIERAQLADDKSTFWPGFCEVLEHHPSYAAYAIVYAAETFMESDSRASPYLPNDLLQLVGSVRANGFAPTIDLSQDSGHCSLATNLKKAATSRRIITLSAQNGTMVPELAVTLPSGIVDTVCVVPILAPSNQPRAFLVLGVNPRTTYEDGVDLIFMEWLGDVIAKAANAVSHPEDKRPEHDFEILTRILARPSDTPGRESKTSEEMFASMAQNAPFGMFVFRIDGAPVYVNNAYLTLHGMESFEELVVMYRETGRCYRDWTFDEDKARVEKAWQNCIEAQVPGKFEYQVRLDHDIGPSQNSYSSRWLESISFPEFDKDGNVVAVCGWTTNISHRKMHEEVMTDRLQDALENKSASLRFIDMVSHEMRNPLSSILQLADSIVSICGDSNRGTAESMRSSQNDIAEAVLDAAKTIVICAQHQKKIVDDILVLSKLDSSLLVLSPEPCHPPALIENAFQMLKADIRLSGIQTSVEIETSYLDLGVEFVLLDQSRVLQVIMNLIGNAIKFTRGSSKRRITVYIAAMRELPCHGHHGINFVPLRPKTRPAPSSRTSSQSALSIVYHKETDTTVAPGPDRTVSREHQSGGSDDLLPTRSLAQEGDVFLQFAVEDTGRGLTKEEMDRLFQRFSQASPKTYKEYGGSGLGLFISKELTELLGGQIGARSEGSGMGSTFAFYVKTKACPAPRKGSSASQIDLSFAPVSLHPTDSMIEEARPMGTKPKEEPKPANGLHILIVEDNAINQKVMAQQLRRLGHTIHIANHGLEALDFLKDTQFHQHHNDDNRDGAAAAAAPTDPTLVPLSVVLMDVEMPQMDGLSCTREIRRLQATGAIVAHVPIIAITANARNEQIGSALDAGVDDVVTKPFRIPDLVPRMQALVAGGARGGRGDGDAGSER